MGIFQRFEDDVPPIFVALFVTFLVAVVVFLLSLFVLIALFPIGTPVVKGYVCVIITLSAAGATAAITLAKLRKKT